MPSDRGISDGFVKPSKDMGFDLEAKRSSKQKHTSKTVIETFQLPHGNLSLKYEAKLKAKNFHALLHGNLPDGLRQDTDDRIQVHRQYSGDMPGHFVKGKAKKDDELIKYMSNLPGYLQRVERGENIQEKALNVGVLDWSRLEKWKYNQNHGSGRHGSNELATSSILSQKQTSKQFALSSTVPKDILANKSKQLPSTCSTQNSSDKDGLPRGTKLFKGFETASKSTLDEQKKIPFTSKYTGRNHSDVILERGKRKDLHRRHTSEMGSKSSNVRHHGVSVRTKESKSARGDEAKKVLKQMQESDLKERSLHKNIASDVEASSSKSINVVVSSASKRILSAESDETMKEELQNSETDDTHQHLPGEPKKIILLLPKRSAQNSNLKESQEVLDDNLSVATGNSSADGLSRKCAEPYSEIPCCSPLPSRVETGSETAGMVQSLEPLFDASSCSYNTGNMLSEDKYAEKSMIIPQNANLEAVKILDQEMAELAARKSRTPSPNHRFSFSLSRMTRSFSFKEGSSAPQLSSSYVSVKSGPVSSEASVCLDDSNRVKVNGHQRSRSSPLRRMLDPLLKQKRLNPLHTAETLTPSKGSSSSFNPVQVSANESLVKEKYQPAVIQALLQLTIRNGLPLFRFVVDNSSNVLAATMKVLNSSGKEDLGYHSGQNFTFYSVNEIKKKSGSWISHGTKEKSCGYVYNVIGQMKISSSCSFDMTAQDSINQFVTRESVLFGVERKQADPASTMVIRNTELAAIIVRLANEKSSHDLQQSDNDVMKNDFTECLLKDGCFCNYGENQGSNSTTVILPGGIHSVPTKVLPSSLIDRWKSGGSCDCGGWDVGCKLRVLSNQNKCCKVSNTCQACLNPCRLELFVQGEGQQNRPMFSLTPHKRGIYMIEFNSSISALQAFFISVTAISSQKSSDLLGQSDLPKQKIFQEPTLNASDDEAENKPTLVTGKLPAKYAPNPPLSPVGRV